MEKDVRQVTSKSLSFKTILITGATGGFGSTLATNFAKAGADLVLLGRNRRALEILIQRLSSDLGQNQKAQSIVADLKALDDIPQVVTSLFDQFGVPHILINNAGIQGPIGRAWENNWQAWRETIVVNFLAPVALCRAVVPKMLERGNGKIINISGGGAATPRPNFTAYSCSKAAIVRFSETLAEELRGTGITVNCIAPGALNTKMTQAVLDAGSKLAGEKEYKGAFQLNLKSDLVMTRAADMVVFLASSACDGITGKLISAVWDPWETLPEHIEELNKTDIYTLRRIVPKDRGMEWGG